MYDWYRSGFTMNIIMAVIGVLISVFEFVTYNYNRKEYFNVLYELDDMTKPMMNTMSMSTIHSKSSAAYGYSSGVNPGGSVRGGPTGAGGSIRSNATLSQSHINTQLPRLASSSSYGYNKSFIYEQPYSNRT